MQHNLVKAYALPKTFQKPTLKLTKFLLVALFCGVGSCGLFGEDVVDSGYSSRIVGFASDTTAIILKQYWEQIEQHCGGNFGTCDRTNYKDLVLQLVDIRFEKIYWEKNVTPNNKGVTFIDSTLFFFEVNNISGEVNNYHVNQIMIRKLEDEKFQQTKKIDIKFENIELKGEGWKYGSGIRIRPWHSGLILANSRYEGWRDSSLGNRYALIDTIAGTFERFTPSGEYEWMNDCADVKWSSVGGLCLKQIPDTIGFVLLKNNVDTLAERYDEPPIGSFFEFSGNSIDSNGWIYLINEQGQVSENPLSVTGLVGRFHDSQGNVLVDYNKKF